MNFRHVFVYISIIVLTSSCALANRPGKPEDPVSVPEKLLCLDTVLKNNKQFINITLEEKEFMKRNLLGDYSYIYHFKLQNAYGEAIVSYPLLFGSPEIYFRIIYENDPPSALLKALFEETIVRLKENCPDYDVRGRLGKRKVFDGCE